MSQAELADVTGLSKSALSRFELGQSIPDAYEVWSIARVLDRDPGSLFELIDLALQRADQIAGRLGRLDPRSADSFAAIATLAVDEVLREVAGDRPKPWRRRAR